MRKIIDTELKFKEELSNIELYGIERMIDCFDQSVDYFVPINNHTLYGLAYTSSSSYAMYNVTAFFNYEGKQIDHFAITENNMLIMVCMDENEDYHYYEVTSEDITR